jgi:hypothetical protein
VVEKETGVEVVVKEKTKGVNIFEITYLWVETRLDATQVLTILKDIVNGIVHWVVEQTSDVVLVGSDSVRVAVFLLHPLKKPQQMCQI